MRPLRIHLMLSNLHVQCRLGQEVIDLCCKNVSKATGNESQRKGRQQAKERQN